MYVQGRTEGIASVIGCFSLTGMPLYVLGQEEEGVLRGARRMMLSV